jgi:hypothetical protein
MTEKRSIRENTVPGSLPCHKSLATEARPVWLEAGCLTLQLWLSDNRVHTTMFLSPNTYMVNPRSELPLQTGYSTFKCAMSKGYFNFKKLCKNLYNNNSIKICLLFNHVLPNAQVCIC